MLVLLALISALLAGYTLPLTAQQEAGIAVLVYVPLILFLVVNVGLFLRGKTAMTRSPSAEPAPEPAISNDLPDLTLEPSASAATDAGSPGGLPIER